MSFLFFSNEKEKLYLRKRARAGDHSSVKTRARKSRIGRYGHRNSPLYTNE